MRQSTLLTKAVSYQCEFIMSLKQPDAGNIYLQWVMGEYQTERDLEVLLVVFGNIAKAKEGIAKLA
jgi:hypothetical protein